MAGNAGRRQPLELADRGALVAGIAIQRGVRADQREAVQVLVDLLHRDVPSLDVVALLAVGAHLALVNVRVAIGALLADVGEHHLDMALRAVHTLVHAAQRIFRGVVIELRNGADRLPSAQRVAVLTRNTKAAMGAPRVRGRLRLPARQLPARENRQREYKRNE